MDGGAALQLIGPSEWLLRFPTLGSSAGVARASSSLLTIARAPDVDIEKDARCLHLGSTGALVKKADAKMRAGLDLARELLIAAMGRRLSLFVQLNCV